ncbi:nucleolar transcription factor 1-like [Papaver somniferum]|uniref:nucleolar transcription factor 1-like n=1 Tax=Papaver somniferum TaxID=3469 RepID=UPI000E701C48|nr:nucleolar transcription factor 1-like [Papaver somniferum]
MVTSSSSDYDYDYSSSSSDEDSKAPEMKIFAAESRAKMDQPLKKAKEAINGLYLDQLKTARDRFSKRKAEDEIVAEYREKRLRIKRRRLAAEEKLRSHPDGIASDSDVEEEEPEEYWDAMYVDPDEREDFGDDSNSDSEEEIEEDSTEDDDGDDESDESDD